MKDRRNVLVATEDRRLSRQLCRDCARVGLAAKPTRSAGEFYADVATSMPRLVCVDGQMDSQGPWPLYCDIALTEEMWTIPLVVVIPPGEPFSFRFADAHCAYVLAASKRLSEGFVAVLEELTDARRPLPSWT
jgi:hypothetical protein